MHRNVTAAAHTHTHTWVLGEVGSPVELVLVVGHVGLAGDR